MTWALSSMPRTLLSPRDATSRDATSRDATSRDATSRDATSPPGARGCGAAGAMGSRSRSPARSTVAVKGRRAAVAAPMLREAACSGSGWSSSTQPSMAMSTSALRSPAAAAMLPSSTRDTASGEPRVIDGTPTVTADVKRHAQASTRFAMTPALITAACCRGGRFSRRLGSSGSVTSMPSRGAGGVIPRSMNLLVLRYRGKDTKPPIGSSRSTYRTVPPGCLVSRTGGPKPMENSLMRMPCTLAAAKCPASCTTITEPSTARPAAWAHTSEHCGGGARLLDRAVSGVGRQPKTSIAVASIRFEARLGCALGWDRPTSSATTARFSRR